MGEVLVITASRRVASWAKRVAHLQGALGTRFEPTPRVLLLAGRRVEALLDPMHPELALFAAWAVRQPARLLRSSTDGSPARRRRRP
ncbi:hypothetical protein [Sorangium sp. So ce124]|uniref:hypothetical protein n=1 Tax=Sorangium sp. So ce124 TaxID=3133280 RepID=UPI003F6381E3